MQTYKLLEQDSVLLSQPLLIENFGRAGAQFLNQLHYWLQRQNDFGKMDRGIRWIYNSAQKWAEQLRIGPRQIQRIIKKLSSLGIVQVQKLSNNKYNRTNHYTIDYDCLQKHLEGKNPLNPAETSIATFCHDASRQDVAMYRQILPNKDINKSEDLTLRGVGQGNSSESGVGSQESDEQVEPVKQVININFKNQKTNQYSQDKPSLSVNAENKALTGDDACKGNTANPKTSTTQDMLTIWNETLGHKTKALMSKDLAPLLVSAYGKKFEKNLGQWQNYCELIKSSSYLMGDHFQLSIFWGLKFSTIDRIRAGNLGVKLSAIAGQGGNSKVPDDDTILQMIEALDEPERAKATRLQIVKAIDAPAYLSWFHQAKFETSGGEIQIVAPNTFVEDYWDTHFSWVRNGK